jgi:hypothetical protein
MVSPASGRWIGDDIAVWRAMEGVALERGLTNDVDASTPPLPRQSSGPFHPNASTEFDHASDADIEAENGAAASGGGGRSPVFRLELRGGAAGGKSARN